MFKNKRLKRAVEIGVPLVVISTLAVSITTYAAPSLLWRSEVNRSACEPLGNPIINVQQRIVNTVDSGQVGNYWAFDNIDRIIRVYPQNTSGFFCADVSYVGKFDAVNGQTSPGRTGVLLGDEDGHFDGGYRASIQGNLKEIPLWRTYGSVGTTNYLCDLNGNCPGAINWVDQYFEKGYQFNYDWWGWQYKGKGNRGTWVNSIEGNSGDVL